MADAGIQTTADVGGNANDSASALRAVGDRLGGEFAVLPAATVRRQVEDAWVCVRQLGLEITPWLVERVAREHLTHLVRSEPPSGRGARHLH
ncbi:MAG TPA: hypothetical protein VGL93_12585 [Streptosporangiaceae bacterium]|jgi:hypothetical protein